MKKIAITLVLSTGLIGMILTACLCKDVHDYWKPASFTAEIIGYDNNGDLPVAENDTVYMDSLNIYLDFQPIYHSGNSLLAPLYYSNSARAMQPCPIDGNEGMRQQVSDFKLTSNQDFDSIPAGQDLSHLAFYRYEEISMEENKSFIYDRISWGLEEEQYFFHYQVCIKNKPANQALRTFEFEWTFTNGDKIKAKTQAVVW